MSIVGPALVCTVIFVLGVCVGAMSMFGFFVENRDILAQAFRSVVPDWVVSVFDWYQR